MTTMAIQTSPAITTAQPPADGETTKLAGVELVGVQDIFNLTTALFAMQNAQQSSQESEQETAIHAEAHQVKLAMEQVRVAAEEASQAAEKSSFWSDVASTAKVIAAVATVVAGVAGSLATGGLSTLGAIAFAGALISAGSKPIAQAFGGGDNEAFWIGLGGGALALAGGGAQVAGSTAATGAETAGSTARTIATTLRTASVGVGAGTTAVAGGATIAAGDAQGEALDKEADGLAARSRQRISQSHLDELIGALKDLDASFRRAKGSLLDAAREVGNTNNMLLATLGR